MSSVGRAPSVCMRLTRKATLSATKVNPTVKSGQWHGRDLLNLCVFAHQHDIKQLQNDVMTVRMKQELEIDMYLLTMATAAWNCLPSDSALCKHILLIHMLNHGPEYITYRELHDRKRWSQELSAALATYDISLVLSSPRERSEFLKEPDDQQFDMREFHLHDNEEEIQACRKNLKRAEQLEARAKFEVDDSDNEDYVG